MLERLGQFGHRVILYDKQDYLNAIKRWGSVGMAAYHLDVHVRTVKDNIPEEEYMKYIRKPPIISAEFNHYVMRPW